jgi:hypothetical protein
MTTAALPHTFIEPATWRVEVEEQQQTRATSGRTRKVTSRALATTIVVLAVVAIGFVLVSKQRTDPAIETIEDYGNAWYSGDHDTALAMLGVDPQNSLGFINWSEYEAAIDAEVSIECEARADSDGVYDCLVHYSNALFDAVDAPPEAKPWVGLVHGERIEVRSYDNSSDLEDSWRAWLESSAQAGTSPCRFDAPPIPECAAFQLANLDEWASWYEQR